MTYAEAFNLQIDTLIKNSAESLLTIDHINKKSPSAEGDNVKKHLSQLILWLDQLKAKESVPAPEPVKEAEGK